MRLDGLEAEPVSAFWKGAGARAVGRPLAELGALGLSVLRGDLPLPAAVLHRSAVEHNLAWMAAFCAGTGISLCPHGKTTMAPQLFARQLAAGAWGLSAATASHVRTYRRFGVPRILLANQLIGPANIDLVLSELEADPDFDFYCLVDSTAGLEALTRGLERRPLGRPLQVLLELGPEGGRTGLRHSAEVEALGRRLRDEAPRIALRGVEVFEGVLSGPDAPARVSALLESVAQTARQGADEGWFAPGEILLSAGGSAFFDLVPALTGALPVGRPHRVVLRSGCYLSHDVFHYGLLHQSQRERLGAAAPAGPGLTNALEVWAELQSAPEPGRVVCGLGKRDISHDLGPPAPLRWFRPGLHERPVACEGTWTVTALYDQHAVLTAAAGAPVWQVGDLVGFGVAHPCTTFDKWALLHWVDEDLTVTGGVRTLF